MSIVTLGLVFTGAPGLVSEMGSLGELTLTVLRADAILRGTLS